MDGKDTALMGRLATALAAFDDEALAAVANKGLVRRARKDMEKAPPAAEQEVAGRLRLTVEGCSVDLAEAPAKSSCSCASGVCRHILAAVMFVREQGAKGAPAGGQVGDVEAPAAGAEMAVGENTAAPAADPEAEIVALSDERIQAWAGKTAYRKAVHLALRGEVVFEKGVALVIRFPAQNAVCRWMPGQSLEGMLCSCHRAGACEHKVAAVLAVQVARGGKVLDTTEAVREASAGAARTREEVCDSVRQVLCEMLALGFSRLSKATEQRLRTLAVSAHGVDLPRLERLVKSLADEIMLLLARDAQAVTANILASAARVEALCVALARPSPLLVGEHRSRYELVTGELELIGLGAKRWRSRSGYCGLTVYFWDAGGGRATSWCDARPLNTPGFDPAARYQQGGPWAGCNDPKSTCRSEYRVAGAWRNSAGRLSGRAGTRALRQGNAALERVPSVARWAELNGRIDVLYGGGMMPRYERDELVLLAPTKATPAVFDPVRQEATAILLDSAGKGLPLRLKHLADTPEAVGALERIDPADLHHVLGLLHISAQGVHVEPVTLYVGDKLINVTLDTVTRTIPLMQDAPAKIEDGQEEADEEPEDHEEELEPAESPLGRLLAELQRELEAVAEAGMGVLRNPRALSAASAHCASVGLDTVAEAGRGMVAALETYRKSLERDPAPVAARLLRAAYVVRLAVENQAAAVASRSLQ